MPAFDDSCAIEITPSLSCPSRTVVGFGYLNTIIIEHYREFTGSSTLTWQYSLVGFRAAGISYRNEKKLCLSISSHPFAAKSFSQEVDTFSGLVVLVRRQMQRSSGRSVPIHQAAFANTCSILHKRLVKS
jgi:hypothetical protein